MSDSSTESKGKPTARGANIPSGVGREPSDPPESDREADDGPQTLAPPTFSDATFEALRLGGPNRFATRRPIPFQIVAPSLVVALGALLLVSMSMLGLLELGRQQTKSARETAQVLTSALLARLERTTPESRDPLLAHAARTSGATLLLLDGNGALISAFPTQPLSVARLSEIETAARAEDLRQDPSKYIHFEESQTGERLIAVLDTPDTSQARGALLASLLTFAIMLLSAAGIVAWTLARDVHADVLYLRALIVSMASDQGTLRHALIPVRTIDQVGQLTASFNVLLERFFAAERAYRQDLSEVNAFSKDRSEFLAALSHELRTPLNVILGFTDVLLSEMDGPLSDEARENLTIVRTSGEHLRSLIDDILTLSALESGEFRLSRENLDLHQVASDVVTEASVTASGKGIELHIAPPVGKTEVFADRRRMRQVLGNVIGNAVKFTAVGGVTVVVRGEETEVIVTVTDTGPGIEKGSLERIFDEFEQSTEGTRQRTGTGLGLSITRRLTHLHGGSVRAESTLGEGSTFWIRIPRNAGTASIPLGAQGPILMREKLDSPVGDPS